MPKILESLKNSDYLVNTSHTCFTILVEQILNQEGIDSKKFRYVHGLLQYAKWHNNSDIFQYVSKECIQQLQQKQIFFIFDASTEGFSPIYQQPFFDMLYYNCKKYNVSPEQIIFVSANLQDEKNMQEYCAIHNRQPLRVFSFPSFEMVMTTIKEKDQYVADVRKNVEANYQDKYFSSLSRRNRQYRTTATFLLCQEPISQRGLISHDRISRNIHFDAWKQHHSLNTFSDKQIKRWFKTLPRTVDYNDFNINWAIDTPFEHIHNQTIFQIVNETEMENYNNTALFLSEKTFRPISQLQPFVIYGQQGSNMLLKELGYQLYDEWFDLDFDSEPDNILRYKKLLLAVIDTCSKLDSMSRDQQIEWRFKNTGLLLHNYQTMCEQKYSRIKLKHFFKNIFYDH